MRPGPSARAGTLLSVVIATHNRREMILRTLKRLDSALAGLGYEIVIVDNASTDGTGPAVSAGHPRARVLGLPENVGVQAFNAGVAASAGEFVLVLDDDAWPDKGAAAVAIERMRRDRRIGAVALHPRHPDGGRSEWPFAGRLAPSNSWPMLLAGQVVRRAAWDEAGGYESAYFLYGNDTDLALKLLGLGWKVHCDLALVVWHDSATAAARPARWFDLATRNRIWTGRRHAGRAGGALAGLLAMVESHGRAGLSGARHGAALRGAAAGWLRKAPPLPEGARPAGRLYWNLARMRLGLPPIPARPEGSSAERCQRAGPVPDRAAGRAAGVVTAVIPSHNRHEDVAALLRDLARVRTDGMRLKVVVVDNASSPALTSLARPEGLDVGFVRLDSNTGGSGGFNAGLRAALREGSGLIWLLDSDVRVREDTLRALWLAMEGDRRIVAAGAAITDPETGRAYEIGGRIDRRLGTYGPAAWGDGGGRGVVEAEYLSACCMLVRGSAAARTGPLPDVFLNCDDVEWTLRMRAATGGRLVGVTGAVALHRPVVFPTWARYCQARNAFGPIDALGLGAGVRFRRAMIEVVRAIGMLMLGREDLSRLHLEGLAAAARGRRSGPPPAWVLDGSTSEPGATLDRVLTECEGARSVWVDPELSLDPGRRRALERWAAGSGATVRWAHPMRRQGPRRAAAVAADLLRAAWRLVAGPADGVAVVGARDDPSVWVRGGRTVVLDRGGAWCQRWGRLGLLRAALGVCGRGLWLAVRLGAGAGARRGVDSAIKDCPGCA